MRKRFRIMVASAALLLVSAVMHAQAGVDAGYLYGNYRTRITTHEGLFHRSSMHGFYVGVSDDIRLVSVLGLRTGLYYNYLRDGKTQAVEGLSSTASREDHSLVIPVHLKLDFKVGGKCDLFITAGPSLDFGLVSDHVFKVVLPGGAEGKAIYSYYTGKVRMEGLSEEAGELVSGQLPGDRLDWFDVALGFTAGVRVGGFFEVKAGYDWGMVNRFKKGAHDGMVCNKNLFNVGIGFRF